MLLKPPRRGMAIVLLQLCRPGAETLHRRFGALFVFGFRSDALRPRRRLSSAERFSSQRVVLPPSFSNERRATSTASLRVNLRSEYNDETDLANSEGDHPAPDSDDSPPGESDHDVAAFRSKYQLTPDQRSVPIHSPEFDGRDNGDPDSFGGVADSETGGDLPNDNDTDTVVDENRPIIRMAQAIQDELRHNPETESLGTPYMRSSYVPSFMQPEKTKSMATTNWFDEPSSDNSTRTERVAIPLETTSYGNSALSHHDTIKEKLDHVTAQIYQLNGGKQFNINSPKQVAMALFGENQSTNKDVLEALASNGNEMAACVYKFRALSRELKREVKRMDQAEKGFRTNDYYGNLAREKISAQETSSAGQAAVSHGEPLLLIDASAYIHRSYHALPPLHHSDGTPTGALHGMVKMLQRLLLGRLFRGERPRVVLVFDPEGPNFRHELYPEYKANRGPCPEDLIPQFSLVKDAATAFGLPQIEAEGYEADDVIATLAKIAVQEGVAVDIMSGELVNWSCLCRQMRLTT